MRALIILAHPEPSSFNSLLAAEGAAFFKAQRQGVQVIDLYASGFDPVEGPAHYRDRADPHSFAALAEQRHAWETGTLPADVQAQIAALEAADLVVLQFPIWWHSVPAILKGWFDRVFVSGGLYTSRMRYDRGYFRGKRVICSVTAGAPVEAFMPGGRGGELDQILWSTHFSLYYLGFDVLPPHASFGVSGHGYSYVSENEFQDQFATLIADYRRRLAQLADDAPLTFPGWEDWDDLGRPLARPTDAAVRRPLDAQQ